MTSRLLLALCLSATFSGAPALACSVFSAVEDGRRVMARNFDWDDGAGYLLYAAPGARRAADSGFAWTSGLASLTFHLDSQAGANYSVGGINEKGLAIEAVWLRDADYGQGGGPELNEAEWITYNLDNFATVREVIENAPKVQIRRRQEPLHYMGCDPSGCFTLEYLKGQLKVYSGGALPYAALTNLPYQKGVDSLPSFTGFGGERDMAGSSPAARFARAAYFLANRESSVSEALESLKIPSGPLATRWSYVYDLAARELTFDTGRTYSLPDIAAQFPGSPAAKLPLPY